MRTYRMIGADVTSMCIECVRWTIFGYIHSVVSHYSVFCFFFFLLQIFGLTGRFHCILISLTLYNYSMSFLVVSIYFLYKAKLRRNSFYNFFWTHTVCWKIEIACYQNSREDYVHFFFLALISNETKRMELFFGLN